MIKKLIDKLFTKKISEEDIECAIDEQLVDCKEIDEDPYVGVPAPILNPIDEWFSSSYGFAENAITQKQKDYMERETELKMCAETADYVEPANIHQVMYEIATKSQSTALYIDPPGGSENFQGGSENIQQ